MVKTFGPREVLEVPRLRTFPRVAMMVKALSGGSTSGGRSPETCSLNLQQPFSGDSSGFFTFSLQKYFSGNAPGAPTFNREQKHLFEEARRSPREARDTLSGCFPRGELVQT